MARFRVRNADALAHDKRNRAVMLVALNLLNNHLSRRITDGFLASNKFWLPGEQPRFHKSFRGNEFKRPH